MAACTNNKVIDDKVNLAPAEMKAVLEQRAKINAERVEIESVSMLDTSVRIIFYNSVVGDKNANVEARELVANVLQYTGFQPQFSSYHIKYEFRVEWFFGMVKRNFSNEIFITKEIIQSMIAAMNKPELTLPAAIKTNLKNGNYETVIALSDSLLKMDVRGAGLADIHLYRAYSFLEFQDTLKAIKEYDIVMLYADTLPKAWPILAGLYQQLNETAKEKLCWLKAMETDSANGEICYKLAQIARMENRQGDCCKLLHKAAQLNYAFPQSELLLCE